MGDIHKQDDQESVNWQEEKAQFKVKVNAYDTVLKNKNAYIKRLVKELELRNEQLKQFQKAYNYFPHTNYHFLAGYRWFHNREIHETLPLFYIYG